MPKRKAEASPEQEEEESPKKTMRQKREEARARAREWAAREASGKKKAAAKKSTTPTRPTRTSTPKRTTPTRSTAAAAKRTTPTRSRAKKTPPVIKSPEPAPKRQKLNTGAASKKLTKKQQMQEARERAQEWADKQLALDKKKKSATPKKPAAAKKSPARAQKSPKKSPPAKKSPAPSPESPVAAPSPATQAAAAVPVAAPPVGPVATVNGAPAPAIVHNALNNNPEAAAQFSRQQQEILYRAQMENAAWNVLAANMPQTQQGMYSPQQLAYQQQVMQEAQRAAAYAYGGNPQQQAWRPPAGSPAYMPPPSNAMGSPQQQSVASQMNLNGVGAGGIVRQAPRTHQTSGTSTGAVQVAPAPFAATPPVASTHKTTTTSTGGKKKAVVKSPPFASPQEEEEADTAVPEQEDVEVEGSSKKKFRFLPHKLKKWLLPGVVAIAAVYFAFLHPDADSSEALEAVVETEPVLPPCFISHPREEDQVFENCDHSQKTLYCPEGGFCSSGQLKSCVDPYMAVSSSGDACVLSAETNETLANVEALLAEWTLEHTCSLTGCAHAVHNADVNTRAPFFDMALIKEQANVSDDSLFSLSDSIVILSGDSETIVGLKDEYLDNKLIVPMWCYLAFLAFEGLYAAFGMVVYAFSWVTEFVFHLTMVFPLATVLVFAILWGIYVFRKNRQHRTKLRQDTATVRELVYGKLVEDTTMEHFVIHLRDEVAMELFPTSKTKRAYIIKEVWPRVVADVKTDNRVMKTTKMWQGTARDAWQWTASSTRTPGKK